MRQENASHVKEDHCGQQRLNAAGSLGKCIVPSSEGQGS